MEAMEEAQRSVGLQFDQGHEVWQLCREITAEQLEDEPTGLSKERALRELFSAQMALPLAENDLVMSEFRAWNTYNELEPDAERRQEAFDKAEMTQTKVFGQFMKKLKGFEEAIAANAADPVELERTWVQYLNFVIHRIAPLLPSSELSTEAPGITGSMLVISLFERAVAVMCLYPTIWAKYMDYISVAPDMDNNASLLALCHRAVRNVSFDSSAWVELVLAMEQSPSCSLVSIAEFVEQNVLSRTDPLVMDQYHFLNVLLTLCDISRRVCSPNGRCSGEAMATEMKWIFSIAEDFLSGTFPEFTQGLSSVLEYQAKLWLSCDCPSDEKKSNWESLWSRIVTLRGQQAEVWATFYQESMRAFTMDLLSATEIRTLVFEEALKLVKDYPSSVAELWVAFERENGDLGNFLKAKRRRDALLASASATPAQPAGDSGSAPVKRKLSSAGDHTSKPKRAKNQHNGQRKNQKEKPRVPTNTAPKEHQKAATSTAKKHAHEALTNDYTLFVCNLSKDATREELAALFSDITGFKETRLVVKMRGERAKSRGMAYVQFSDENGVIEGLTRNGSELHGQAMKVDRSTPPPAGAAGVAKGPTSSKQASNSDRRDGTWKTNPTTIYVGGLNGDRSTEATVTSDDLLAEAIGRALGEPGIVVRACILKDKRGKPKNYGLVELAEANQVAKCLSSTVAVQSVLGADVSMKPSRFSIDEILEQQQQQKASKGSPLAGKERAGGKKGRANNSGLRLPAAAVHERPTKRLAISTTSMSLMPRALRKKQEAGDHSSDGTTSGSADAKPMTNNDFRQFLTKK